MRSDYKYDGQRRGRSFGMLGVLLPVALGAAAPEFAHVQVQ